MRRRSAALSQATLAARAGMSRQSLVNIENDRSIPSTLLALKLAQVLGCCVEDLFALEVPHASMSAALAPPMAGDANRRAPRLPRNPSQAGLERKRLLLGRVANRWVAHVLRGEDAIKTIADGLGSSRQRAGENGAMLEIEPLLPEATLRESLIVAGCDPALPLLASWLREFTPTVRLSYLHAPSQRALESLSAGWSHIAGSHLLDEPSGQYNVPVVRKLFAKRGAVIINLARWEEGFVVRPGNPLEIRDASDLARPGIRLVRREPGAGAELLLDRSLHRARIPRRAVLSISRVAPGHLAVARTVAHGEADVGVATRGAALAYRMGFVPLAEERSDVVINLDLREDWRIGRIVDVLGSVGFRRELETLGGYDTSMTGRLVEEVGKI